MKPAIMHLSARKLAVALALSVLTLLPAAYPALAQVSNPYERKPDAGRSDSIEDALNIWEKRVVQEGLILLGYYNGFANGDFGQGTRTAIAKYQQDHNRPASSRLGAADALELAAAAFDLRKKLQWQPLENTRTGATISYPAGLFDKRQDNTAGGETLASNDGQVSLKTMKFANVAPGRIEDLFQTIATENGTQITYQFKRENRFILSGTAGNNKFYSRFEQRGNEIRGYDLTWASDKYSKIIDGISVLISNGFYPFGDNASNGQPSYPTLLQLAKQAGAGDKTAQSDAPSPGNAPGPSRSPRNDAPANSQTAQSGDKEGVTEQKPNALPPPKDGSLINSDGKGLSYIYHYFPPEDSKLRYAYQWAVDTHLFLNIPEIEAIDGLFVVPRTLHYVGRQCGTINAFYDKKLGAIFLCYEMIDSLLQMGQALSKGASDPKALTIEFVRDNLRFILLHESGHALIDLLDLPAVGREEDSVDQLAAVMLLWHADHGETKNDLARVLQLASVWFKINSQSSGDPGVASFADEHSLDAQRYFNLLCIVYGLNPDQNGAIIEKGMLPKERAARCPAEASKINRSWARLLLPHFSPRFQPKDDNGKGGGDSPQTPAPAPAAGGNPLEWDKNSNPFGK